MKSRAGFTLIEIIVFMLVASIALGAVLLPLVLGMLRAPDILQADAVTRLATQRMEWMIGQRQIQGFSGLQDPCSQTTPPAICTLSPTLSNYTINPPSMSPPAVSAITLNGDNHYQLLHVQAATTSGVILADLYSLVASE